MTKKTRLTVDEALALIEDESTAWTLVAARSKDEIDAGPTPGSEGDRSA